MNPVIVLSLPVVVSLLIPKSAILTDFVVVSINKRLDVCFFNRVNCEKKTYY